MKKIKKIIVSVGTSAFNEEQNIMNMLTSVIRQKEKTITIKEIIVISDGSIDDTVNRVESIRDKRIKVFDDGKRLGQPSRIGQLLKIFKGEIFILIDSDMVLKDNTVFEKLISQFKMAKNVGLVCGETYPLPGRNFLERAISNYKYARADLERKRIYDFGKTAYCAHAFLAYSKKFGKSLSIPKSIINPDAYSYFVCIKSPFTYKYARNAIVYYRSPSIIKDHINQSTRHLAGGLQLCEYFGEKVVKNGFYIPLEIQIRIMFYQLLKNPLGYIFLKLLNAYCGIYSKYVKKNFDVRWNAILSSKQFVL